MGSEQSQSQPAPRDSKTHAACIEGAYAASKSSGAEGRYSGDRAAGVLGKYSETEGWKVHDSNQDVVSYVNESGTKGVVAFPGVRPDGAAKTTARDLARLARGGVAWKRVDSGRKMVEGLRGQHPGITVTSVGHSRGAAEAVALGNKASCHVETFNGYDVPVAGTGLEWVRHETRGDHIVNVPNALAPALKTGAMALQGCSPTVPVAAAVAAVVGMTTKVLESAEVRPNQRTIRHDDTGRGCLRNHSLAQHLPTPAPPPFIARPPFTGPPAPPPFIARPQG